MNRKIFLAGGVVAAGAALVVERSKIALVTNGLNDNASLHTVLGSTEILDHAVIGTRGMAREYPDSYVDRDFRTNGLPTPSSADYQSLVKDGFRSYRMHVGGLVEHPQTFDLAQLRAVRDIDKVFRHDCVEGWSAVGKFGGVRFSTIANMVRPKPTAKYVLFNCYDVDEQGSPFYGSVSLAQSYHPQTMLQLDLNDRPLDADHGGPVRLRVPTQLAYKSTKWIKQIAFVETFKGIFGGGGGYWEDNGYEWYAGI